MLCLPTHSCAVPVCVRACESRNGNGVWLIPLSDAICLVQTYMTVAILMVSFSPLALLFVQWLMLCAVSRLTARPCPLPFIVLSLCVCVHCLYILYFLDARTTESLSTQKTTFSISAQTCGAWHSLHSLHSPETNIDSTVMYTANKCNSCDFGVADRRTKRRSMKKKLRKKARISAEHMNAL